MELNEKSILTNFFLRFLFFIIQVDRSYISVAYIEITGQNGCQEPFFLPKQWCEFGTGLHICSNNEMLRKPIWKESLFVHE